jgi:hypothetical protein
MASMVKTETRSRYVWRIGADPCERFKSEHGRRTPRPDRPDHDAETRCTCKHFRQI